LAGLGDIDGILMKDDRVVVGVGDAAAAEFFSGQSDCKGIGMVCKRIHLPGFADVPVLAEFASEIATGGSKGEYRRARQEVVEGLFLDRIQAIAARASIGGKYDLAFDAGANEA